MACSQTLAGLSLDCLNSKGGIKCVYIANFDDVTTVSEADGVITGITMDTTKKFKKYEFRKGTGSMTSTYNADETTGNHYVTTELALVFTRMETAKRIEISALSLGQLAVIVLDSNGVYWYLGKDNYVSASAGGAETGTANSDRSAYTITLSDESDDYPHEVAAAAIADIVE